MSTIRPFDYARYAANQGDVWKHALLVAALGRCAREKTRIRYFETHAGVGGTALSTAADAEWRQGLARVRAAPVWERSVFGPLVDAELARTGLYPGSWRLVQAAARAITGIDLTSVLYEADAKVAAHARAIADRHGSHGIEIQNGDGFAGLKAALKSGEVPDLVLIDPPYIKDDWQRAAIAARAAHDAGATVLLWYPLFSPAKPQQLLESTGLIGYEAQWAPMVEPPSYNTKGVGVAMDPELAAYLSTTGVAAELEGIAAALNAKTAIRRPARQPVPSAESIANRDGTSRRQRPLPVRANASFPETPG